MAARMEAGRCGINCIPRIWIWVSRRHLSSSSLEQLEPTLMTMVCDGKLTCNYAVSVVKNKVIIELICQGNCPHYHKECAIPPRRCEKGSCCTCTYIWNGWVPTSGKRHGSNSKFMITTGKYIYASACYDSAAEHIMAQDEDRGRFITNTYKV